MSRRWPSASTSSTASGPIWSRCGKEASGIRVSGYVAALAEQGPTRGPQHVFVNRRIVKDRTIAHAIIDAYSVASIKERSPEIHLFLEMPPDGVDVNVHPTKAEVRFRNQSVVHEVVRRAVGAALGAGRRRSCGSSAGRTSPPEAPASWRSRGSSPACSLRAGGASRQAPGVAVGTAGRPLLALSRELRRPGAGAERRSDAPAEASDRIRPMIPLGQFRDTFIVAVDDEGIAIIDQHVAHERVLFERVMQRLDERPPREPAAARAAADRTGRRRPGGAGPRAGGTRRGSGSKSRSSAASAVRVAAVPAAAEHRRGRRRRPRARRRTSRGWTAASRVDEALRRIAATTACHAAVKANAPLTSEKMAHILDELRRTAYSTVCPHGRPVMLRLTRREIEKNFQTDLRARRASRLLVRSASAPPSRPAAA